MRRGVRLWVWITVVPIALLLLLAGLWLACNGPWADAAPQPVPPELQPQPVTLAPADNAFFDVQGLLAPPGESPNAWGQRGWQVPQQNAAGLLVAPSGPDWSCDPLKEDCVARWRAAAPALAAQRADAYALGERCRALAARVAYQEPPLRRLPGSAPQDLVLPQFQGVTACMRWLQIDAVLAPDLQQARAAWTQADALLRRFAAGSQSLIGQAIGWSMVQRQQVLLAQWSARQAAGDAMLGDWMRPMPQRLLQPRFWMAAESTFQRDSFAHPAWAVDDTDAPPGAWRAWWSRLGLGYLPQLTIQTAEARWLADLRAYGHLEGSALAMQVHRMPTPEEPGWLALMGRNGIGKLIVEVARPAWRTYPLRQADLGLFQQALVLSQQLNAVPAAERAAWWQRQPVDAVLRERLHLDGNALMLRSWRGEAEAAHAAPVRFPLRPA